MQRFEDIKRDIKDLQFVNQGWRANVYKGIYKGRLLAFKVAKRPEVVQAIQKEGQILKLVNKKNIGGKLFLEGEDFIAYEFIKGKHLQEVLTEKNIKELLLQLFYQARDLDLLGISKDEMQRPLKNALVDKNGKVWLIDFERSKFTKKPSNITQLLQFATNLGFIDRSQAIQLGKIYKSNMSEENFQKIISAIMER